MGTVASHTGEYWAETQAVAAAMAGWAQSIDHLAEELLSLRLRGGRLFCLGVGGGAANAAHAVNDYRKLCAIEAYAPTDGIAELTARTNDDGYDTVFTGFMAVSQCSGRDALMIFSVGGGSLDPPVSINIVKAVDFAMAVGAKVYGVVGRASGYTAKHGNLVIVMPDTVPKVLLTPITETFQMAVHHCLVSHPRLQVRPTKW